MKAYVFPGQGAQFPGMGKDLFDSNKSALLKYVVPPSIEKES